jgi:hypothetical protein
VNIATAAGTVPFFEITITSLSAEQRPFALVHEFSAAILCSRLIVAFTDSLFGSEASVRLRKLAVFAPFRL